MGKQQRRPSKEMQAVGFVFLACTAILIVSLVVIIDALDDLETYVSLQDVIDRCPRAAEYAPDGPEKRACEDSQSASEGCVEKTVDQILSAAAILDSDTATTLERQKALTEIRMAKSRLKSKGCD